MKPNPRITAFHNTDYQRHIIQQTKMKENNSYERFYFTKSLLHSKYHDFIVSLDSKEILTKFDLLLKAQKISEKEFVKLLWRIEKWNNLEANIPLIYLDFIGLKTITIETTVKQDMIAFQKALEREHTPQCFFANTSSGLQRIPLPVDYNIKRAIEAAINWDPCQEVMAKYIKIKDLKTIYIQPDGTYYTVTYPPAINIRKGLLIPSQTEDRHMQEELAYG